MSNCFLDAYSNVLAKSIARSVEKETASGLIKDLLRSLKSRLRQDFLDKYTKKKKVSGIYLLTINALLKPQKQNSKKLETSSPIGTNLHKKMLIFIKF
ncbi:hypothetical protein A6769_27940 [Nostoc punctiforme NIES-2108]|uniref:Uncharacterized protein n=1 Tax=Nostoc punctiforme NIES-2108 TaxID=1356359 RepID=A0A367RAY2_NOSPU|nr:hypothetical protein A6769_27940 [Nostoc punctiforme NIES-2108]